MDDGFRQAVEQDFAIAITVLVDDTTPTPYTLTAAEFATYRRRPEGTWTREPWQSPNAFDANTVELGGLLKTMGLNIASSFNTDKVGIVPAGALPAYLDGDTASARFVGGYTDTLLHDGDTVLLRRKGLDPDPAGNSVRPRVVLPPSR